ncbi:insulinase family protein [Haematospirillum jordaniae]|uniref:Peptidase M16 n=1 Tax=Haematospirillum jordaniae TaxID=1549855 RepID=A0A143DCE0_9PROT|nr:pitrilysin family protein [Haematospirillum jordaniae]AMW34200.1 peptidase M16 [Haematospirillum jordaniae]NKD45038.1 insulinase family protein [Haematospirillum jordaniae]NKD57143.1 insulinase family protein [Haematospirillum jordaniae]NKD59376.1 insulinase family protein [Haematospirillum jordaniae]NKD67069.1 insulinase family protein [Haematospirillum jordaniae]
MTVTITTLPSGLRVLTDRMDTVQTVTLGAWVDAGARHEPAPLNGISHLLEHMAFKGTARRSARAIAEEIEDVGGILNAWTSRENTAYYAKVLKDDVALATDIIADILQYSAFDPEELKREQSVIVQEINQAEDTPDDIVFDHFQATAYPDQAMGRTVLGTPETVRSIDRETLKRYMNSTYSTHSTIIAAAGHIDHDSFVHLVEKTFTSLPVFPSVTPEKALYKGGESRQDKKLEQVHLVLGFDGVAYDHPHFYATAVLSTLLGGGMSSRLFQEIREKRGLVYSIYSYTNSTTDGGLFSIYAGTGDDEAAELVPVLCTELRKIVDTIAQNDELMRARAQIKAGLLMGLESSSNRAETAARQLFTHGRIVDTDELVAMVESVDAAAVRDAAALIFASDPTLAVLGPSRNVPSLDAIKGMIAG